MTEWALHYNISGSEDIQLRCRLHLESLTKDPNVKLVTFESSDTDPNIRIIRVLFIDGETQPRRPDLRHLDRQFIFRPQTDEFVPYPLTKNSAYSDASFESWRRTLPAWATIGTWVIKTENQVPYRINRIYEANYGVAYLSIQEWRSYDCVDIPTEFLKSHFKPTSKPADPLTWHQRLLLED